MYISLLIIGELVKGECGFPSAHVKEVRHFLTLGVRFGYVQFDSIDSARRAIDAMHMRVYEGRRVIVAFAQNNIDQHRNLRPISRTIYIGNLPFEMTDRDINELFRDIINVIDVRVSVDRRTGMFRGFAHAEFINVESARAAFEILSRKAPYGRKLRLDYSQTNRRADRLENNSE